MAVVTRSDGLLLAFERTDVHGAWQLPQGGLDPGESPLQAVWREVGEETGLTTAELELVAHYPDWIAYEIPTDRRSARTGLGQVQRWYQFRVLHDDIEPSPDGREFRAWRWATPKWLIDNVVDFRRRGYEQALTALLDDGCRLDG